MRIVVSLFFIVGISLNVSGKPAGNHREISFDDETIRAKNKREDDSSNVYLEQCGVVKFQNAKRGFVNVLAFLDSSWPYSHRQAIMLKMLSDRLRRSGLIETLFFAVNVKPYLPGELDSTDDDIEREAWLGVSPEEIESFSEVDKNFDSLTRRMDAGIKIIQDDEMLGIWKLLGGSRDQVLVIDRCGKLTYQVIVPWSILHFPYVKAAILSTYKDEPCGHCDANSNDTDWTGFDDLERLLGAISPDVSVKGTVTSSEDETEQVLDAPEGETTMEPISSLSPTMIYRNEANDSDSRTAQLSGPEDTKIDATSEDNLADRGTKNRDEETILNRADNLASASKEENSDFHTEISLVHREETTSGSFYDSSEVISSRSTPATSEIAAAVVEKTGEDISGSRDFRFRQESTNFRREENAQGRENDNDGTTIVDLETSSNVADSRTEDDATSFPERASMDSNLKSINDDADRANYVTNFYEATTNDNVDDIEERRPEVTMQGIVTMRSNDFEDDAVTFKMAVTLHDTTTPLINVDARDDDDYGVTNVNEATTKTEDIDSETPEVFFATTDAGHFEEDAAPSEMADPSVATITDSYNMGVYPGGNYDTTGINEATSEVKVEEMTDKTAEAITDVVVDHSRHFVHDLEDDTAIDRDTTTEDIPSSSTRSSIIGRREENPLKLRKNEDNEDEEKQTMLPIRIIMHAPHFHIDRDSTRMHEYIVLKTGSSATGHGHLASNDATRLYRGPQDYYEKMGDLTAEEIEKKEWPTKNLIFLNDESTGLFGEVADYWRENENQDNYEDAEDTERPEDARVYEEDSVNEKSWTQSPEGKNDKIQNGDKVEEDKTNVPIASAGSHTTEAQRITETEEFNYREEETRNKLIVHYSKLLPWIYYVLDK